METLSKRTPSSASRSATRRLTLARGIFNRRAASEKLVAFTTAAKITSELKSLIFFQALNRSNPQRPLSGVDGRFLWAQMMLPL